MRQTRQSTDLLQHHAQREIDPLAVHSKMTKFHSALASLQCQWTKSSTNAQNAAQSSWGFSIIWVSHHDFQLTLRRKRQPPMLAKVLSLKRERQPTRPSLHHFNPQQHFIETLEEWLFSWPYIFFMERPSWHAIQRGHWKWIESRPLLFQNLERNVERQEKKSFGESVKLQ